MPQATNNTIDRYESPYANILSHLFNCSYALTSILPRADIAVAGQLA